MLEIRTISGTRLDVYPTATIEVNMGGISLLNLQDRTATYTNSFKLPRTPTNESVFEFASQPTRNNRPVIDVIITKGLVQRLAVLKVIEFEKDYKCSVSYTDILIQLNETIDLFSDYNNDVAYEILYQSESQVGLDIAQHISGDIQSETGFIYYRGTGQGGEIEQDGFYIFPAFIKGGSFDGMVYFTSLTVFLS